MKKTVQYLSKDSYVLGLLTYAIWPLIAFNILLPVVNPGNSGSLAGLVLILLFHLVFFLSVWFYFRLREFHKSSLSFLLGGGAFIISIFLYSCVIPSL